MNTSTETILDNGLKIIHINMPQALTATVLVLVATGSEYETKENNGISHFLEHMCFKGTEKRPTTKVISHELDAMGSQSNAFTSQEYTGYYAKADATRFAGMLDVIADIYQHATLPEAELQKEKGVIIEEINMYEDMPKSLVQEVFSQLLYGDTPAGRPVLGPKENIMRFTREDFITYRKAHYVPNATTVIVAGNVPEQIAVDAVKNTFGKTERGEKAVKTPVIDTQQTPAILLKEKPTDQAHFVLGFRTITTYDPRNPIASVIANVLSGGLSSRLSQKLREEMGVCYYVQAYHDPYIDHGIFSVAAGVDTTRMLEVVEVVRDELKKLKTELVGDKELSKVKAYMSGNFKMHLESTDAVAEFYGNRAVLGKPLESPEMVIEKINNVTAQEIQDFAKTFFVTETMNLAAISRHSDSAPFAKILSM